MCRECRITPANKKMRTTQINADNSETHVVTGTAPAKSRKISLSTSAADLQAERNGLLPVWIRSPKTGPEHYSGFTRAKLYALAGEEKIRSVSIRDPGQVKGVRLFNLASILDFIARCEANAATDAGMEGAE